MKEQKEPRAYKTLGVKQTTFALASINKIDLNNALEFGVKFLSTEVKMKNMDAVIDDYPECLLKEKLIKVLSSLNQPIEKNDNLSEDWEPPST